MPRLTGIQRLEMPPGEIALALAWLRGELTLAELAQARGSFNAANGAAWVAPRLKEAFRQGRIVIKDAAGAGAQEHVDR